MRRFVQPALVVLCLLLAAAAVPARALAQDITCDPGDREVKSLEFRGNHAFSGSDLEVRIATTESGWFRRHIGFFGAKHCLDRSELPLDVLRLKKFYHDNGYYNTQVDTLVQPLGDDGVRVRFTIDEGAPVIIDSLAITGLDSVPNRADVLAGLALHTGMPFNIGLLYAELDTITARLRNTGYPSVDLLKNYTADTVVDRAEVSIRVLPGPRSYIGPIRINVTPFDANTPQQIGTNVVRKLLGIKPGDLYSDEALIKAQRSLYQLGAYRHVDVSVDSAQARGDSVVTLQVDLREDQMQQLDTKYGWATLDCFRTSAQYTNKNFLHQARHLEIDGQLSKIGYGYPLASSSTRGLCYQDVLRRDPFSDTTNYSISATLQQPGLFGSAWVPSYSLYRERRSQYLAYLRSTLIGGEAAASRGLSDRSSLRLAYSLEYGRTQAQPALLCAVFNRCDQQSRDQITHVAQPLAVASAQYTFSNTDDPFNPTHGFSFRSEVRSSLTPLGSSPDLTFNKGTIDAVWYHGVGRSGVFAVRLRGGLVVGPDLKLSNSTRYIPPEERLYAGGANSVRGFYQNELGSLLYIAKAYNTVPVNDSTAYFQTSDGDQTFRVVPVGGNSLVVANFEYRIPDAFLPQLLQWTLFTDGGDVWTRGAQGSAFSLSQIRWTPGVGIRVFTPVGPLQVNVGYNPYPRPRGAIYYDASFNEQTGVAPLYCVSPGNSIPVHISSSNGTTVYAQAEAACPATFAPAQSSGFFHRLTLTFSIGPEF
jgi:outer membrane protein insertion porin family/translocation and assembly module TamA